MERLTLDKAIKYIKEVVCKNRKNKEKNTIVIPNSFISSADCAEKYEQVAKWLKELKSYKEAEEHGLLVRLPCKEAYTQSGNYVYLIADCEIVKCVHCGLGIDPLSGTAYITLATDEKIFPYRNPDPEQDLDPTDWCTNATDVKASKLGKTVFLTREEAVNKLEEIKNDKA